MASLIAMIDGHFLFKTRHFASIIQACRRSKISIAPHLYGLERLIAQHPAAAPATRMALLRTFVSIDDVRLGNRPIVVAAMPKSASTFFCAALTKIVGGAMTTPHNQNDAVGVAFDQLDFVRAYYSGGVMHSHLDASDRVIAMLKLLDIRPIVQTRNIFDALASYLDHSDNRLYAASQFAKLDDESRRRVGILRMARHYVDMVASWSRAETQVPVMWLDFESVRLELGPSIKRALRHARVVVDPAKIRQAVVDMGSPSQGSARFNKGKPGRGAMFTDEEKSWVRSLYTEYPDVDFTRIDPELGDVPRRVEICFAGAVG